jgi:hypothetical protein
VLQPAVVVVLVRAAKVRRRSVAAYGSAPRARLGHHAALALHQRMRALQRDAIFHAQPSRSPIRGELVHVGLRWQQAPRRVGRRAVDAPDA